jgi:hypothetical protein
MKRKAFLTGIFSLILILGMIFAGCAQPTDSGGNNNNNNQGNQTPTTGTLVITNTSLDYFIVSVEVREHGETTVKEKYTGAALGKDKSCQFSLPTGVYDITLTDDYPETLQKNNVVVTAGKETHLTYNGNTIL